MAFYPNFREEQFLSLNAALKELKRNPDYLTSPECPWSETIKDFFRQFQAQEKIDLFTDKDEVVVIDQQIQQIINDLESVGAQLGVADHQEKLNYFKTKTTLLEKLIGMRERTFNLKEINEFRNIILAFLDETCTKDQITDLMRRLDGVLGGDQSQTIEH